MGHRSELIALSVLPPRRPKPDGTVERGTRGDIEGSFAAISAEPTAAALGALLRGPSTPTTRFALVNLSTTSRPSRI
ncbi:MAG: hypothetical protein ABSG37_08180 [Candidatus Limnocylindrales bacterium]